MDGESCQEVDSCLSSELNMNPSGSKLVAVTKPLHLNVVDKKHLARAIKFQSKGIFEEFAWIKKIPVTDLELKTIKVDGLGDISIPVSLQVIIFSQQII